MKISFYKSGDLSRLSYVKLPLTFSALILVKNDDKKCFPLSVLAESCPC